VALAGALPNYQIEGTLGCLPSRTSSLSLDFDRLNLLCFVGWLVGRLVLGWLSQILWRALACMPSGLHLVAPREWVDFELIGSPLALRSSMK